MDVNIRRGDDGFTKVWIPRLVTRMARNTHAYQCVAFEVAS